MGIVVMLSGRTGIEIDFNFSSPGRLLLPVLVLIVPALGTESSGATYVLLTVCM